MEVEYGVPGRVEYGVPGRVECGVVSLEGVSTKYLGGVPPGFTSAQLLKSHPCHKIISW